MPRTIAIRLTGEAETFVDELAASGIPEEQVFAEALELYRLARSGELSLKNGKSRGVGRRKEQPGLSSEERALHITRAIHHIRSSWKGDLDSKQLIDLYHAHRYLSLLLEHQNGAVERGDHHRSKEV